MACRHCYIQPELLRRKEYIDEATYRECVKVIIEAFHLDESVSYLHLDVLGGEATLMPFEFWERNLPWTLDRVTELNEQGIQTEFTFCTNLMWKDERYLELLRAYRHHPAMDIAISFEGPESNRFGRNMAIFPKFLERIEALGDCNMFNLVLIMGQGVIDLGPQFIIDTFVKRGITDITCDMIFPWGSGRAYFEQYQPQYSDVVRFIAELTELGKPYGLTVDHLDDMDKSLRTLSRSQNTLNDAYEYHWDQRGLISLNPNQTGTEAVRPHIDLNVWDKNAALKVVWGNSSELDNKLSFEHDFCRDCKFLQACNSGWYPHKALDETVLKKYMQPSTGGGFSCPGLYELWESQAEKSFSADGVTKYGDARRVRKIRRKAEAAAKSAVRITESDYLEDYEGYFEAVAGCTHITISPQTLFGLTPRQRLWFYDRIGKHVEFSGSLLDFEQADSIIAHAVAGNYHTLDVPFPVVEEFVLLNPQHQLSRFIVDACSVSRHWRKWKVTAGNDFTQMPASSLEISYKFEDLLIWCLSTPELFAESAVIVSDQERELSAASWDYMCRIEGSARKITSIARRLFQ